VPRRCQSVRLDPRGIPSVSDNGPTPSHAMVPHLKVSISGCSDDTAHRSGPAGDPRPHRRSARGSPPAGHQSLHAARQNAQTRHRLAQVSLYTISLNGLNLAKPEMSANQRKGPSRYPIFALAYTQKRPVCVLLPRKRNPLHPPLP
jgi:hypothetical protein